jgi:hypothetical protein
MHRLGLERSLDARKGGTERYRDPPSQQTTVKQQAY